MNLWNGRKFNCSKGVYWRFRALSDELCREHGLTVIQNPSGKTARSLYFAEKRGEPTRYNLMRQAIDDALACCWNEKSFHEALFRLGYEVDFDPRRKYATICSLCGEKPTRLYRLGEKYDREAILDEIERIRREEPFAIHDYYAFLEDFRRAGPKRSRARVCVAGSLEKARRITGLRALYFRWCCALGILPRGGGRKPLSPELRAECRRLDRYSDQVRLIARHRLTDLPAVENFIRRTEEEMALLTAYRKLLYRDIAACGDPEEQARLLEKRRDCTAALTRLRKEKKTAEGILADHEKIKDTLRIEAQTREELYPRSKQRERGYER